MPARARVACVVLFVLAAAAVSYSNPWFGQVSAETVATPKLKTADAAGWEEFVWSLFVYAVTPSGDAQRPLTFETWQEQCDLQPALCEDSSSAAVTTGTGSAKGRVRRGHGSALGRRLLLGGRNDSSVVCQAMNVAGFPPLAPATNVAPKAVFCEEVFVNKTEADFIRINKLTTLAGQQAFGNVTFPWEAVEIKVDWVPQSSFLTPFKCTDPTLYIETIEFKGLPKQCYAMVGMHISSKALPDWVWATFEPNSAVTNPNRCNANLYSLCFDPWGTTSPTPYGPGSTPAQSAALGQMMKAANLAPAFNNYYLTGVQTQFVRNGGEPTLLGNSFVEFNAGVQPGQASCITCHKYAYAGTSSVGSPLLGWPSTGYACNTSQTANCLPPPGNNWTSEDFSWLLGIMPQSTNDTAAPATGRPAPKASLRR